MNLTIQNFNRKNLILTCVIFAVACLIICGVVIFPLYLMRATSIEYTNAEHKLLAVQNEIQMLRQRNKELENLVSLDVTPERISLVEFFTRVQKIFQDNGISILSITQNDADYELNLKLEGDYYAFVRALAELRLLSNPVKTISLSINKSKENSVEFIEADLILATMRL